MSKKKDVLESRCSARRKKILRSIKGEAALFCAASEKTLSRDLRVPYRQNSDFFYLTGFDEPEAALLLLGSTRGARSVLFLRDRDLQMEKWSGVRLGLSRAKRKFNVDVVKPIESLEKELEDYLLPYSTLHFSPGENEGVDSFVWNKLKSPVGPRLEFPNTLKDARLLTSQMRIVKDRSELGTIRHVCDLTAEAVRVLALNLGAVKSERHAATMLEAEFTKLGAQGVAFPSIVASGKNATFLHHSPGFQPLWKRELVLFDVGASFNGYAADISRTLPRSGVFSEAQAEVYDIVHDALVRATELCYPGSSLDEIHKAAVSTITKGLVRIGVLEGNVSQLISTAAYKKFFMHRTSHWLGLDVHDISPVEFEGNRMPAGCRPLEVGNVFTVEPGIYFDPKDRSLPERYRGIGIRIEDDIAITSSGCEVLTARMPSKREEIEELMK